MAESKFPSEVIDLPSEGKLYPKEHPCSNGKIEIKYMTAKEEDILTSQNLIKKGVVIDRLMDSLILTPGVKSDDLILGDKNAVMVASRVLAYGPEYVCDIINPNNGEKMSHQFNLTDCPFKKLPEDITENKFEVNLPISKKKITFKILTGKEEVMINEELKASEKINAEVKPELTTRLRHTIISVDGDDSQATINNFVQNLLARDSMHLRKEIPMTVGFFWPDA